VRRLLFLAIVLEGLMTAGAIFAGTACQDADKRATEFVAWYEREIRPLEIESNRLWWEANTTGNDSAYQKKEEAENKLNEALANRERFAQLKSIREAQVTDGRLRRQIDLLYLAFLGKQLDPALMARMTSKANAIEKTFNAFRAKVGEQELTDSQVRKTLLEATDSQERQAAWEASKRVGRAVERDVRELVMLRNESAQKLGFDNYHQMMLRLNEQDPQQIAQLFDELDELTREPFLKVKSEIDQRLAQSYGITVEQLRPWHYHDPFFQESPNVFDVDLDATFAQVDILDVCKRFYDGIGLPIDDVIAASDLYEKPGKSPHAFCTDIDRDGDVRVLANIVPNSYWMGTMMHELGHAVYSSKNIPDSVPYLLRTDAHILTTEGIAMMFERFPGKSEWLDDMGIEVADAQAYDQASRIKRRNQLLIFSRWCQVMFRFEMAMYANPDQDLNALWWSLVEKYQGLGKPDGRNEPDYASKIHVVSAPCYYHNYMMGELFACQLHATITREVLGQSDPTSAVYHQNPAVGEFLRQKVFAPGRSLPWNDLTRLATGEELTAEAFAHEFQK
jgi:peptidyl-dipeptidase A